MLGSRSLEDMISHRVTFDLVGGRRLIGYLAGVDAAGASGTVRTGTVRNPAPGAPTDPDEMAAQRWRQDEPNATAHVVRAQLLDEQGRMAQELPEVQLKLSSVISYRVTEGPGGF